MPISDDAIFYMLIGLSAAIGGWGVTQILVGLLRPDKRKLQERIQVDWKKELAIQDQRALVQRQPENLSGLLGGLPLFQRLNYRLRLAFPSVSLERFLLLVFFISGGLFAGMLFLTHSLVPALVLAVIAAFVPFFVVSSKRNRRQRLLGDQLMDALDFLARILRAGHSLSTGFQMMGDELPEPIATEFRRCYDQTSLGQPIEESMKEMATRADSADFAFFVTSVLIQRQTGGDLAELLDNISTVVRNRIRLQQHVQALTAEGRATGYLLTALPPGLFLILYYLNPDYAGTLINTPQGIRMVIGMACLQAFGLFMIKKIVTVKV